MPNEKILIVEDEPYIVEILKYNLIMDGFKPSAVYNGKDSLEAIRKYQPDLVLLDLMLPGMDGLEICRAIRNNESTVHLPVIMLTAKSQEVDRIMGFDMGADDYVTKPFSGREVVARVKAVLRRNQKTSPFKKIEVGDMVIDTMKHHAAIAGETIHLTYTEFKLLVYMSQRPGEVLTRDMILNEVFDYESESYDRSVDNHVKTLRKKLGSAREYIKTVRGCGYSFKEF